MSVSVVQAHTITSPTLNCSCPRSGLEKDFSMHDSPVQKLRTWNEGWNNLWTHPVMRSTAVVDAEVMSWYRAGTELISGNSQRRSKGADFTQTLFQNINLNRIFTHLFSTFTSFHSLCLYSKCSLKHKEKSSESSEHNCQELCCPASWRNILKNLSRTVPSKSFANATRLQACWGRLEEFSKCHRDMQFGRNQTPRLWLSSSALQWFD